MSNDAAKAQEVLRSWNRCHGAFYQVREGDLLWNSREQDLVRYWSDEVDGVPVLWAEPSPLGIELGILPGGLWMSLFGEINLGAEAGFIDAAEKFARDRGKKRLAIGGDEFHFLPGLPVDDEFGEHFSEALKVTGFSSAGCADFVGAPSNSKTEEYIGAARADAEARGWTFRLVRDEASKEAIEQFLGREFPGRWAREWRVWSSRKDTGRVFWNLLRDENNNVLGFSRLGLRGRFEPLSEGWNPGALRLPLSDQALMANTDSCLGPIGIAASERGRGAGRVLLGLSLHELSLQGAERTCVDWTNAYNYYTPLGFSIVRRYLSVWKNL